MGVCFVNTVVIQLPFQLSLNFEHPFLPETESCNETQKRNSGKHSSVVGAHQLTGNRTNQRDAER